MRPSFHSPSFPPDTPQSFTLAHNVSAIQIFSPSSEERSKLGLITQLPEGVQVVVGGPGFDDRTVKVRFGNAQYYVFAEDLTPTQALAASSGR